MKVLVLLLSIVCLLSVKTVWCQSVQLPIAVPVIIEGQQLAQFTGKSIANIRVFSLKNHKLSSIPFQIDQRNSEQDWVWDVTQNHSPIYDDEDPKGQQLFDHNDQLVFLTKDLGEQAAPSRLAFLSATIIQQIQVLQPESNRALGRVYIAYFNSTPPPLSSVRYMDYHPKPLHIKSDSYQISYSDKHIALIDQLSINGYELIDRLKIRGEAGVGFLFLNSTIKFNEEEVAGYPVGYINGPVRTIKRVINYVELGAGMRSPSLNCDHFFYPNYARIPILLSRSFGVKKMSLRIGLDFHNANFQYFYAQGMVNIRKLEKNKRRNLLSDANRAQWQVLSGPDYSLYSLLDVPENIRPELVLSPYILYESKLIDLPEKYHGMEPESGFNMKITKDFPYGEHILYMTNVLMTKPYKMGTGEKLKQLLSRPLKVIPQSVIH